MASDGVLINPVMCEMSMSTMERYACQRKCGGDKDCLVRHDFKAKLSAKGRKIMFPLLQGVSYSKHFTFVSGVIALKLCYVFGSYTDDAISTGAIVLRYGGTQGRRH